MRILLACFFLPACGQAAELRGRILDATSNQIIPARIYLRDAAGGWHHAQSLDPNGTAINYDAERAGTSSVEIHTTLSAHGFRADVPAGRITLIAERGLEYRTATLEVEVPTEGTDVSLKLERWSDLRTKGWFSGDVFLHRKRSECGHLALAEDLNVVFPIHYWTTESGVPAPRSVRTKPGGDPRPEVEVLDSTHVVWPVNTEVELFTVDGQPHMQGAFWVFGHRGPLNTAVPPVGPITAEVRAQGGFIDTEKPNWPWTMMLIPTMQPHFYRLLNNHHWRTAFGSGSWKPVDAPAWMGCEKDDRGDWTEDGWTQFGLRSYYALLNCGFRLIPTAGTGSGVHPVPAGFSRTYVRLEGEFSYEKWMAALDRGNSFVTNGPMLLATFEGESPGHVFRDFQERPITVRGTVKCQTAVEKIELIGDGAVLETKAGLPSDGTFSMTATVTHSQWVALRAWEKRPDSRRRLAHTAPVWFEVTDFPSRPKKHETQWLVERIETELARHRGRLPAEALGDYENALAVFRDLDARAR